MIKYRIHDKIQNSVLVYDLISERKLKLINLIIKWIIK